MKILISGASGFVGQHLVKLWQTQHEIFALGRDPQKIIKVLGPEVTAITWQDLAQLNPDDFAAVVNLAGESINHLFWTKAIKHKILQSRINATEQLVAWCCQSKLKKIHFLSTSALSIYGIYAQLPSIPNNETTEITQHPQFLAKVADAWEQAAKKVMDCGIALTLMRFAIVLSKDQGALPKLLLPAYLGLSGRLGSGQQPFAWISIDDLLRAIDFIVQQKLTGPVNMVAPQSLTQYQFSHILAKNLHRPCFMRTPAWLLRLGGGMPQEMLLQGLSGEPAKLLASGFNFNAADLTSALKVLGISKIS